MSHRTIYQPPPTDAVSPTRTSAAQPLIFQFVLVVVGTAAVAIPVGPLSLLTAIGLVLLPVTAKYFRTRQFTTLRRLMWLWVTIILAATVVHFDVWRATLGAVIYPIAITLIVLLLRELCRGDERSLAWLAVAVGLGIALGVALQPIGIAANQSVIKSGYGLSVVIVWLGVSSALALPPTSRMLISLTLSGWLIFSDFRSGAAIVAISALVAWVGAKVRHLSPVRVIALVALGAIFSMVGVSMYSSAAEQGFLGSEAQQRYLAQSAAEGGLLLAGRPELVVSLSAISNHFWLGRGGDPSFSFTERLDALGSLAQAGITLSPVNVERVMGESINSHSLLFTSWVAQGVFGITPWVALAALLYVGAYRALRRRSRLAPLIIFFAFELTWDILFSPWSPREEVWLGLALTAVLLQNPGEEDEKSGRSQFRGVSRR